MEGQSWMVTFDFPVDLEDDEVRILSLPATISRLHRAGTAISRNGPGSQ